ncbi:tyrosine-type recombinase/integrase [Candidatus Woesearchaeota archaeon]|nr:tyrosine-type recombinase/integrase [Candidatus Woesearchaeota archaeon]
MPLKEVSKMKTYIYDYEKGLETARNAIEKSAMSKQNKKLLFEFEKQLVLEGLSKPRIIKYLDALKRVGVSIKDFKKADKKVIQGYISQVQARDCSEWTKLAYRVVVKRFYKWLRGTEEYPPEVSWMKISFKKDRKKLPSEGDLLTEADIKKLISKAKNSRDKAFISTLYESGCRIGELGSIKLKNVTFDKYGTLLCVDGKTGPRKIRVINSTSFISQWLNDHPDRNNKEAFLWVTVGKRNEFTRLSYEMIRKVLRLLFKEAGIKKNCNPHIFRHSRATFLANHLTEFQMNQYFGWIQGSDMPSTYVHLSGKNTDDALLKLSGVEVAEKKTESKMKPLFCPRCDTINNYDSKYCAKCGALMDIKEAILFQEQVKRETEARTETDDMMNKLFLDPAFMAFV